MDNKNKATVQLYKVLDRLSRNRIVIKTPAAMFEEQYHKILYTLFTNFIVYRENARLKPDSRMFNVLLEFFKSPRHAERDLMIEFVLNDDDEVELKFSSVLLEKYNCLTFSTSADFIEFLNSVGLLLENVDNSSTEEDYYLKTQSENYEN